METNGDEEDELAQDEDKEENPYDHNLDLEVGAYVLHKDLVASLAHLPWALEKPMMEMRTEMLVVDKNIIAIRLVHLQQCGVILCMVDFNPSRDGFEEWVYREIGENLKVKI